MLQEYLKKTEELQLRPYFTLRSRKILAEGLKYNAFLEQQAAIKRHYLEQRRKEEEEALSLKRYIESISVPDLTSFETIGRRKEFNLSMK